MFQIQTTLSPLHKCPCNSLRALISSKDEYLTEEGELADMEEIGDTKMSAKLD